MRHEFSSNLLHNPFYNRFNVPVTQRREDMQSYANGDQQNTNSSMSNRDAGALTDILALFLVIVVSVFMLLKLA